LIFKEEEDMLRRKGIEEELGVGDVLIYDRGRILVDIIVKIYGEDDDVIYCRLLELSKSKSFSDIRGSCHVNLMDWELKKSLKWKWIRYGR